MQTVHTAKGTEFNHVYIIGLVEDYFPAFQAKKQGDHSKAMEEERRNCFVAVTRASETLYMSYAHQILPMAKRTVKIFERNGINQVKLHSCRP